MFKNKSGQNGGVFRKSKKQQEVLPLKPVDNEKKEEVEEEKKKPKYFQKG